jgi:Transposase domain (DUF772)
MRALLLQAFYSIRSERQLVERIDHDLLFRWFVWLGIKDPVLDATTFTKNGDRLLEGDMATSYWPRCCRKDKLKARCRASISRSTASRRSGEAMMRISRPLNPDTRLARKGPHRRTVNKKLGFNGKRCGDRTF